MKRHLIRIFSCLVLCVSAAQASSPAELDVVFEKLDGFLDTERKRFPIPNMEVLIVHRDTTVYHRSFGKRGGLDVPYYIGSNTKSFTALGIMVLVQQGRLDLNQSIHDILPYIEFDQYADKVTIQTLLNHTSGINHRDRFKRIPPLHVIKETPFQLRIQFEPGTHYLYSNLNYAILGLAIEEVTGMEYASFINEFIFEPCRMTNSYANTREEKNEGVIRQYRYWFGIPIATKQWPFPPSACASGFIRCSISDMANFLNMHMNDGVFGERELLHKDLIRSMYVPWNDEEEGYGAGWELTKYNEQSCVEHIGATPTSFGGVCMVPQDSIGIVILTNSNSVDYTQRLVKECFAIIAGGDAEKVSLKELRVHVIAGILLFLILSGYLGRLFFLIGKPEIARFVFPVLSLGIGMMLLAILLKYFMRYTGFPFRDFMVILPDLGWAILLATIVLVLVPSIELLLFVYNWISRRRL